MGNNLNIVILLTHFGLWVPYGVSHTPVNTGLGNGLCGVIPLPEPMLTNHFDVASEGIFIRNTPDIYILDMSLKIIDLRITTASPCRQ